ncbi:hypothetical protein N24_0308 [Corynebacterium suranareeae]|uniref:Uncharacterized protein n=1 Tax=Corynebacterium suranareeae TaxID=2506452 RepID=A0A160PQP0_9CORY|nr:hypothetical protein [Corynebacterium suranareeae]BAU94570.1 hypothetical protein N24_0308 [Corynebacterium suranareeae]
MDTRTRLRVAAGSALVGAGVAVNDYVDSPVRRALGYGALALSGASVIAVAQDGSGEQSIIAKDSATMVDQLRQEIGDLGVTPGPESDVDAVSERGPLVTWLLLAVFIISFAVIAYLSFRLDMAVMNKIAKFFEKRGASKPYTCTGVVYAAIVYAMCEWEVRKK